MANQDTVRLLRECDAGVHMGVASICEVMSSVRSEELRRHLESSREKHERLQSELQTMLDNCHDEGKAPAPMAKSMSWMKTNVKLALDESDATIADLVTDGCNMGVKSLRRYLNQYQAADERAKDITKRLISLEEKLAMDVGEYL